MNADAATVSNDVMAGILMTMNIAIFAPVFLLVIWKLRKKCKLLPALAGALTFVNAALILESIPKLFLFSGTNPVSVFILGHPFVFALTGALLAGIFEECGRYVTFRYVLANHSAKETAVTCGIGHGGIECIIVAGVAMVSNLAYAFLINDGQIAAIMQTLPAEDAATLQTVVDTLTTADFMMFAWGIWERTFALILHISLSVLVFAAVKMKSRFHLLFPIAILLHTLMDIPAGLYQAGVLPLIPTELIIATFSVGCAVFAYKIYPRLDETS
ncbi:MAG: YhfC family intramembrane metalloprotease [Roseburia sp.]|jgi:uncharacterized membrane protein YhfC|nr:YhfC family intramembrane metalloprotease [Roseburia sp.]